MAEINIGTNANFKCSQVLSFTPLNAATREFWLDHSKVKCKIAPNIIAKMEEKT